MAGRALGNDGAHVLAIPAGPEAVLRTEEAITDAKLLTDISVTKNLQVVLGRSLNIGIVETSS